MSKWTNKDWWLGRTESQKQRRADAVDGMKEIRRDLRSSTSKHRPETPSGPGERRMAKERASEVRGRHYVDWVPDLDRLRSEGPPAQEELEALLLECIAAAERAALVSGREPAPGYTERLAVVYRKQKRHAEEVAIIERWAGACPVDRRGPGATQGRLAERLVKAQALRDR